MCGIVCVIGLLARGGQARPKASLSLFTHEGMNTKFYVGKTSEQILGRPQSQVRTLV